MGLLQPRLQRSLAVQAAVRASVIFAFDPEVEAQVQIFKTFYGVRVQRAEELLTSGSPETFDFSTTGRFVGAGVDKDYSQGVQDALGLGGDKPAPVVDIHASNSAVGRKNMFETGLEGGRTFTETESGIQNAASSVIQESKKHGRTMFALGIGKPQAVHAVSLHAFKRREELELQVLLLLLHPQTGGFFQPRRAHKAREGGGGQIARDRPFSPQRSKCSLGGELGMSFQVA